MHVNFIHNIPFFSIFLAMFTGIVTPLIKKRKTAEKLHLIVITIIGIASAILFMSVTKNEESFTFMMGHFPAPWGNELRVGPLESMMAMVFCIVMGLTLIGGRKFIYDDVIPEKLNLYYVMLNLLLGSMLALIYTNDVFTAYVFIEINTIASCALIMAKGKGESIVATIHYLIISQLGSGLFLIGLSLLYGITGHLLMSGIQQSVLELMQTGQYHLPFMVVVGLIVLGVAIKSALFPFHSMLPGAYQASTPSSSGILSGLVLKSYIILIIKMFYCVFTIDVIHSLKITNVIFVFGLAGMVMGSIFALKESKIKRMLAYSSVAQIGYIFMGFGLGTHVGIVAACFHILAHAFTKAMLFVCTGALVDASGKKDSIRDMRGAAHRNKLAGIAFIVGALSMVGVPLFAGFVSKIYFASASLYSPGKMAATLITLALSMILNAMYFIPSVIAIWSTPTEKVEKIKLQPTFVISMVVFMIGNFVLGIFYKPIIRVIELGINLLT